MRTLAVVLMAVACVAAAAPQAVAEAPPAPKVTINGLLDFVTSLYKNWSVGAGAAGDVTDGGKDQGWYSRERGVFTLTGEVGRSKGVLALEFDLTNGFVGGTTPPGVGTTGGRGFIGTTASLDLDTDVTGIPEVKWMYVETPVTGPGSLLPFIPVASVLRAGGQPARGHTYKPGILFSGDFPGVAVETTWAPNVRSALTFVQITERLDKVLAPGQTEGWAILASVDVDLFKGLSVKPTYAFDERDGGNPGTLNHGSLIRDGLNPNVAGLRSRRHTVGAEARWTAGPWSLEPSFFYQWGEQDCVAGRGGCTVTRDLDISSWIADVIGGFRAGPLTVRARGMWTPGNAASERPRNGDDIDYFQPIHTGNLYWTGWSEIWATNVDYIAWPFLPMVAMGLPNSPSYDKYGRVIGALAVDYALTPALVLHALVNAMWTAEKVDTDGSTLTATGLRSSSGGEHRYLGTETALGFTYRFAPNVAFDLIGAYHVAGDALNHARDGSRERDADDIYKVSSRVRITW